MTTIGLARYTIDSNHNLYYAQMSALQNGFNNLSSWKKAVVIAAPVALAGGLLYSYKYRKDQSRSDSSEDIHGISSSAAELVS